MELSIIIPTLNEAANLRLLLPKIHQATARLLKDREYEVLILDAGSEDDIQEVAKTFGATLVHVPRGYGRALQKGFELARGTYIITMDADLSHSPHIIPQLYSYRHEAELIIASRYVKSGYASTKRMRTFLSHTLNFIYGIVFDLNVRDMSSGFRLYHKRIFQEIQAEKVNFVALLELLLKTYLAGFRIREIPFHYHPRQLGGSKARVLKFGVEYLGFLWEGRKLRNSLDCADYEERCFSSRNPLRGPRHRKRYQILLSMAREYEKILTLGCGSSQILDGLPQAVGCDLALPKLRYKRAPFRSLVRGDVRRLPFKSHIYDAAIFVEPLQNLQDDTQALDEIIRVVRPGGMILIAPWVERFPPLLSRLLHPAGYSIGKKSRQIYASLEQIMETRNCLFVERCDVGGGETVLRFQKQSLASVSDNKREYKE